MSEIGICDECGLPMDSWDHKRGVGLHGHIETTKAEADRQRADVMKRAYEFAESQADVDSVATSVPRGRPRGRRARAG